VKERHPWVPILAVAGVALAASASGIGNQLVQDDLVLITGNPRIQHLANWREMLGSPFWPPPYSEFLYRPLTALLLAFEYALGGGGPLVFRLAGYLGYAAASAGVFFLGRRILPQGIAVGIALLFAGHPVHVEAVALAVGQSELLVGLLSTVMAARYLDRRRTGTGRLTPADWVFLGALYLSACLLKEHALVLPGLLLGAELLLVRRPEQRLRLLVPGFVGFAALAGLFLLARTAVLGGSVTGTFTAEALEGQGPGGRGLTMLGVVPEWARLLLWPARLQADYSPREIVASTGLGLREAGGLTILCAALAAGWLARRRAPVVSFGLLWCGIALLPVSNVLVPTGVVLAERTLFLASIGAMIAVGGAAALGRWAEAPSVRPGRLLIIGSGVLALLGAARSAERHQVWRDEKTLATRSAEDAPRSYRSQQAYGYWLFESGARGEGLQAYQRALALAPERHAWRVRNDLARRFFAEGRHALAVEQLSASLTAAPDRQETWHYLILGYLALGNYREAARLADSALARGGNRELFGGHRALADSAARDRAPPGSIRIRIVPAPPGGER
jgi:hypothetical protein